MGLPRDLDRLGERLEAAAGAHLAQRRALRRSLLKGLCAVTVGIPLALAAATSDLAPSARPVGERVPIPAVTSESMVSAAFVLDRVPDESGRAGGTPCVMVPDCRPASP